MKKFLYILTLSFFFSGCEDVVDIDVSGEDPRLIIDALIRVDESSPSTLISVRALESSSFFDEPVPTQLTQITIVNLSRSENEVLLETESGSGIYEKIVGTGFLTSGDLLLQVEHKGKFYLAQTKYVRTLDIDTIEQGDGNLFGDNETEIVVSFNDIPDEDNFYLFDFDFGEYLVTEDTFYRGQSFTFSYFYDDELASGLDVSISILGVDEPFYNYMEQLLEQSSDDFGPFATPVTTVRGNLINVTDIDNIDFFDNVGDPDNFALGYFAVCQTFTQVFTIE
ncbi:DUF4249 family protein [Flavobacteriaceae bacterium M23B6Z8]